MPELSTLGSVIKQAYEEQANTNAFTDPEKSKIASLSPVATTGDYEDLTGKPAVIAQGATAEEARAVIGAISEMEKGQADGVATLNSSGVVPLEQLNISGLTFQGAWDASTNTPELIDGTGNVGDFYKASTAGTHDFGNGSYTFASGDWVIFAAGVWQRVGVHEAVTSVGGKTGAVPYPTPAEIGALPDGYQPDWGSITNKPDFSALYAAKLQGAISPPIPAVYAKLTSTQPFGNSQNLVIDWPTGSIVYDQFSIRSDSKTFVVPSWATHASVRKSLTFDENATGYRYAGMRLNGTVEFNERERAVSGSNTNMSLTTPVFPVSPGDQISLALWQNSGGSLSLQTSTWLQINLHAPQ